jgi:uncharacterized protein YegJ (DUF2314 family)
VFFCAVSLAMGERPRSSTFVPTPDTDPEMDAAIAQAKAQLPRFWDVFDNPRPGDRGFAVKLKFSEGKNWEYMWVDSLQRRERKLFGKIGNEPEGLRNVRLGQVLEVKESEIADWMFIRDGKIHGNYTLRVLLTRMPRSEAENIRARLAAE